MQSYAHAVVVASRRVCHVALVASRLPRRVCRVAFVASRGVWRVAFDSSRSSCRVCCVTSRRLTVSQSPSCRPMRTLLTIPVRHLQVGRLTLITTFQNIPHPPTHTHTHKIHTTHTHTKHTHTNTHTHTYTYTQHNTQDLHPTSYLAELRICAPLPDGRTGSDPPSNVT